MEEALPMTSVALGLFAATAAAISVKRSLKSSEPTRRSLPKPCSHGHEKLVKHTAEFGTKEVIKVTEGIYVAIGYGLANSIMIEGETGLIIVDCMESHPAADDVMTAFRRYSQKPVIALIYTHFHHDHVGGSYAYLKYTVNNSCEVYAHELTASILAQFMGKTGSIGQIRAARQFGNYLPPEEFINSGIGPCLHFNPDCELSILSPSVTFSKELSLTLDGISLRLLHCPGETDDQIVIHVVDKDLLCAADNIYRAFPNLYAIRGTPSRDAYVWAHSLNVMASLNVTHLVPSHTQPITGRDAVREVLSVYRDAVLFVHDQTVRHMNKGYFLDDIVTQVRLPPHLIDHPYLQEFYGTVEWSVRGVFTTYLGWFSGDPSHLHPYSPLEYSQRMIRLAGGVSKLLESAEIAFEENDPQWSLHCTQAILRFTSAVPSASEATEADATTEAVISRAQELMVASLRSLASREVSANGRNYLLTYAREVEGKLVVKPGPKQVQEVVKQLGAVEILKLLPLRLRSELCEEVTRKVAYRFPDIQRAVTILISRGVAHVEEISYSAVASETPTLPLPLEVELLVTVNAAVFEGIAANERNKTGAILTGDMVVTGKGLSSSLALKSFMDYFEDSAMDFKAPL